MDTLRDIIKEVLEYKAILPGNSMIGEFIAITKGKGKKGRAFTEQDATAMIQELGTQLDPDLGCDAATICLLLRGLKTLGLKIEHEVLLPFLAIAVCVLKHDGVTGYNPANLDEGSYAHVCRSIDGAWKAAVRISKAEARVHWAYMMAIVEEIEEIIEMLEPFMDARVYNPGSTEEYKELQRKAWEKRTATEILHTILAVRKMNMRENQDEISCIIEKLNNFDIDGKERPVSAHLCDGFGS